MVFSLSLVKRSQFLIRFFFKLQKAIFFCIACKIPGSSSVVVQKARKFLAIVDFLNLP